MWTMNYLRARMHRTLFNWRLCCYWQRMDTWCKHIVWGADWSTRNINKRLLVNKYRPENSSCKKNGVRRDCLCQCVKDVEFMNIYRRDRVPEVIINYVRRDAIDRAWIYCCETCRRDCRHWNTRQRQSLIGWVDVYYRLSGLTHSLLRVTGCGS